MIFSARLKVEGGEGYEEAAQRMLELAREQPGFIDYNNVCNDKGEEITISYWENLESVRRWKGQEEHRAVQARADEWYESWEIKVCRVEC